MKKTIFSRKYSVASDENKFPHFFLNRHFQKTQKNQNSKSSETVGANDSACFNIKSILPEIMNQQKISNHKMTDTSFRLFDV